MAEETEETTEPTTKKVKITHSVEYKGTGLKVGVEADLDEVIADRLIAQGHAVEVEGKAKKGKE